MQIRYYDSSWCYVVYHRLQHLSKQALNIVIGLVILFAVIILVTHGLLVSAIVLCPLSVAWNQPI